MAGMIKAAGPMTDSAKESKPKPPRQGPDEDEKTQNAGKMNPNLPDRDGPARHSVDGGTPKKPATSAGKGKAPPKKAPAGKAGSAVKGRSAMPQKTISAMKADLKKM